MRLNTRDFHLTLPLCYTAGNLQGIYEWMSLFRGREALMSASSSLSERMEQRSLPAIPPALSLEWRVPWNALLVLARVPGAEHWSFQLPREACRPSQGNGLAGC